MCVLKKLLHGMVMEPDGISISFDRGNPLFFGRHPHLPGEESGGEKEGKKGRKQVFVRMIQEKEQTFVIRRSSFVILRESLFFLLF